MEINFITDKPYKTVTVSHNLTGKMAGMPAITTSLFCNANCLKLSNITGTVCEKCYAVKYLTSRPNVRRVYNENTYLLKSSIIPRKQLPFINAAYCRLESFGDIVNATHLQNYVNLVKKNNHCVFSLFTKNYTVVFNYFKERKQPKNLSIVISSLIINEPFNTDYLSETNLTSVKIFTVYSKPYANGNNVIINCGKTRCIDCLPESIEDIVNLIKEKSTKE